jgi:hypothetical protein
MITSDPLAAVCLNGTRWPVSTCGNDLGARKFKVLQSSTDRLAAFSIPVMARNPHCIAWEYWATSPCG